jgi:hypothetical protein
LDEAAFFLAKPSDAEAHPHLDEAERQFGYYLSAFLSAARSALQVVSGFEGSSKGKDGDDWTWAEQAKRGWAADDLELYRALTGLRNLSVHEGKGGADSTVEFVTESELPFRPRGSLDGYVFISQPVGEPPPRFGVKRFVLKIGQTSVPAREGVAKYLGLVRLMLDDYRNAPPAPPVGSPGT